MLQIRSIHSSGLDRNQLDEIIELCTAAYDEDFKRIFEHELGPGTHVLGLVGDKLVSHVMIVERTLQTSTRMLKAAYVEAVATLPVEQGKGYGTSLMSAIPALMNDFDVAVLSPTGYEFYERLGWEMWRGPLSYKDRDGREIATPEEEVMIYRLPQTGELDLGEKLVCEWRPGEIW